MAYQLPDRKPSFIINADENKESTTLICFDPNIEQLENSEKSKEQLRIINNYVIFSFDIEQCIRQIESINEEKIFLITSGLKASQILPRISSFQQIDSIFIFSQDNQQYDHLLSEYPKLLGSYIDFDDLSKSIKQQIDRVNNEIESFCFFDQYQILTKALSPESAKFLWAQLFHYLIAQLPQNQQAKRKSIQLCKDYYRGNTNETRLIQEFEEHYQSEDAIRWYLKESFVRKLIHKALNAGDINFLYQFRFFIADLIENLQRQQQNILQSDETILNVYRGIKLDREEFNKIKHNQGKIISTNEYLLATRQMERAVDSAKRSTRKTDMISVLLHIQCDIKSMDKNILFGNIDQFSDDHDKHEVLFDFNTCFEIESIDDCDSLKIIKMNLSDQGQMAMRHFIELKQQQTEEMNLTIIVGRLLCSLGEYEKSKRYFQQLFNDANDEDRAWIEFNIGRVLALNKESNEARIYYNHAYERMMNYKPARVLESAHVLNNIGCLLANQEKYDEAIDYHQRALEIREKFYPPGHIDIAQSLYNIGLILDNQGKYEDSLEYYQTALKIQEKCYPSVHPHIYRSLNSIGIILYRQGKYEQALDYYKHALKIEESLYPSGHDDLTYTLNNIGIILRNKGMHDEALQYCRRALDIEEKLYPSGHSNIAKSLGNIGNILSDQGKSNEALDYHQRALAIQEKAYPSGHVDIGHSLNNIGICYENLNKEKLALHYYQHALTIYEKFLPRDHPRRQRTEHNIHRLTQDD
ncbi:unnamed protein product [Rotaria magnacalcarata]|uniref:Uncharacterized protein n=2 Tax=Rotaria magnacalcarata TaxID=392030 RepID=A0A814IX82_9BILA|nr:unnamed protein product [Rotaria magnacalcarata]